MKTAETKAKDANVEKCVALMRSRADVGLKKYKVTTERTDLTPLEWVRHWQAENADATIYAEKLAQEIVILMKSHDRIARLCTQQRQELEVLRKAVFDVRYMLSIGASRSHGKNPLNKWIVLKDAMIAAADAVALELRWPDPMSESESVRLSQLAAEPAPSKPSKLTPCEQVRLERHEQWMDAQKTPPDVGHAVIGMVNGTTKTRAVYYVAKTGKWVDVNDRPVTVSQWRHL